MVSGGKKRAIIKLSLARALYETASKIDDRDTNDILIATITSYRDGLNERMFSYFREYAKLAKYIVRKSTSLLERILPYFQDKKVDLDLLATLIIKDVIEDSKMDNEIRELISIEELDYLLELLKDNYVSNNVKLIDRMKVYKEHKKYLEYINLNM